MDNNIGGSTPTSLRRSCPFADINNASAGDSPKKRNNIGVFTPTSLTKSSDASGFGKDPVHHDNVHLEKTIGSWSEIHYKLSHCKAVRSLRFDPIWSCFIYYLDS
ncbi:Os02g0330700 [Oryza sativa Japonica Group]|uniref:Os02g0330700 protein n=1 Tax=Oryza sativa subsp. japonica TaxID=39947 RepID=C7IY89_ORYSJ|nr:Os02g0330700 [Oryza sativa Japonica Group]|eukprot:NP_001172929.1 Os02g0330700 [Oryza sativa Japonica Group]